MGSPTPDSRTRRKKKGGGKRPLYFFRREEEESGPSLLLGEKKKKRKIVLFYAQTEAETSRGGGKGSEPNFGFIPDRERRKEERSFLG